MFRTPLIAALTVALLGTTAMAQPANAPPANLSDSARNAPDYDDDDAAPPPRGSVDAPPPRDYAGPADAQRNSPAQAQQAQADRDVFCRRDAAARTGYTTPREAARDEQTRGTVGGTLGGAALGAILGAAGGAFAGNEIEKNVKKHYSYRVTVRMDDGTYRTISQANPPSVAVGEKVRVANGTVVARS